MLKKKQFVGITAVALTVVYSLRWWRNRSPDIEDDEFDAEQATAD